MTRCNVKGDGAIAIVGVTIPTPDSGRFVSACFCAGVVASIESSFCASAAFVASFAASGTRFSVRARFITGLVTDFRACAGARFRSIWIPDLCRDSDASVALSGIALLVSDLTCSNVGWVLVSVLACHLGFASLWVGTLIGTACEAATFSVSAWGEDIATGKARVGIDAVDVTSAAWGGAVVVLVATVAVISGITLVLSNFSFNTDWF